MCIAYSCTSEPLPEIVGFGTKPNGTRSNIPSFLCSKYPIIGESSTTTKVSLCNIFFMLTSSFRWCSADGSGLLQFKSKLSKVLEKIEKVETLQKIVEEKIDKNKELKNQKKSNFKKTKFKKRKKFKKKKLN